MQPLAVITRMWEQAAVAAIFWAVQVLVELKYRILVKHVE